MRVLVVSQYFLPQPLANAETIGSIAAGLGARGHDVHVVTPARPGPVSAGVTAHRAFGYFAKDRGSVLMRLLEYLTFSAGAVVAARRAPRPDVVLVPSPPPTLGLVGLLIGALHRSPVVYNVQDVYPEVALATGAVRARFPLRVLGALMRFVYRHCAAVVTIDPGFVEPLRRAEPRATVCSVRNSIDLTPFERTEGSERVRAELDLHTTAPVVMYAGNVGRSQDLEVVVEATAAAGAMFVVHGGGARLEALRAFVRRAGHTHVRFSGYRPREELGAVYAIADLHVVPLRPGVAYSSLPSKLLSIFAAGRPAVVVAEEDSAVAMIAKEAGAAWLVPPGDHDALESTLRSALADPVELALRGERGRAWVMEAAASERCAAEYEGVLRAAVGARRAGGRRSRAAVGA